MANHPQHRSATSRSGHYRRHCPWSFARTRRDHRRADGGWHVAQVPTSIFDAAYPLPALIANNYGDMMSIPLYDSALLTAALVLLVVILIFNHPFHAGNPAHVEAKMGFLMKNAGKDVIWWKPS